jgi:hypothetical protein
MSAAAVGEALALAPEAWPEVGRQLRALVSGGLARQLALYPRGRSRAPLYEVTEAGALEALGGAQLRIDGTPDRAPVDVQPALF